MNLSPPHRTNEWQCHNAITLFFVTAFWRFGRRGALQAAGRRGLDLPFGRPNTGHWGLDVSAPTRSQGTRNGDTLQVHSMQWRGVVGGSLVTSLVTDMIKWPETLVSNR